jgi:hypothetical protein
MTSTESLDATDGVTEGVKRIAGNMYVGANTRAQEHVLASARWAVIHRGLVTVAAVLSSIAGAAILADASGAWRVVTGVIALVSAAAASAEATLKASDLADGHKRAADGFTSLRTKWLRLQEFTCNSNADDGEVLASFDELVKERDDLSKSVPMRPWWAHRKLERRKAKEKANEEAKGKA